MYGTHKYNICISFSRFSNQSADISTLLQCQRVRFSTVFRYSGMDTDETVTRNEQELIGKCKNEQNNTIFYGIPSIFVSVHVHGQYSRFFSHSATTASELRIDLQTGARVL